MSGLFNTVRLRVNTWYNLYSYTRSGTLFGSLFGFLLKRYWLTNEKIFILLKRPTGVITTKPNLFVYVLTVVRIIDICNNI